MMPEAEGFTVLSVIAKTFPRGESGLPRKPAGSCGRGRKSPTVEVIKNLTNRGQPIGGRLLFIDIETYF